MSVMYVCTCQLLDAPHDPRSMCVIVHMFVRHYRFLDVPLRKKIDIYWHIFSAPLGTFLTGHCVHIYMELRAPRFSPSLPLLKQLHWLPVSYRINFKLSTLTYYQHNSHPTWLVSCIFQISIGSSNHQFHNNLLCLKQNFLSL